MSARNGHPVLDRGREQFRNGHHRLGLERTLNAGTIIAAANEVLEGIDTSMFSLGPPIGDPRPPRAERA